ncbi:MAG: hypothetical protein GXY20_02970 [Clostridiales bacterium]|nr:hypothetical protein [Clostridiales bacterium]
MYGYVRPVKGELLVREYEEFRSVYCGLCHTLKHRYGFAARFILNYDFTFLAMLLSPEGETVCRELRRCAVSPIRKKVCRAICGELELAADISVILAYYRIKDALSDNGFFRTIPIRPAAWCVSLMRKRAIKYRPEYDRYVYGYLKELNTLEKENCDSIDKVADCFAKCLSVAASEAGTGPRERVISQILYHLGRVIYILDAYDDLQEDLKAGRYNAVSTRYFADGIIDDDEKEQLRSTIFDSLTIILADFELLGKNTYTTIITNIIRLGLPQTVEAVLDGTYEPAKRREIR